MTEQHRDERRAGGGGVTRDEFYIHLDQLNKDLTEGHARLRADLQMGFAEATRKLEAIAADCTRMSDRLLIVETERRVERNQAKRDGAIMGGFAGVLGSAAVSALLRYLKI